MDNSFEQLMLNADLRRAVKDAKFRMTPDKREALRDLRRAMEKVRLEIPMNVPALLQKASLKAVEEMARVNALFFPEDE